MQLVVLDGDGERQVIIVEGPGTPVDRSGTIAESATPQVVMDENVNRSGLFLQNLGGQPMWVCDTGEETPTEQNSIQVLPGQTYPPQGICYPVTPGPLVIFGAAGDVFIAREW